MPGMQRKAPGWGVQPGRAKSGLRCTHLGGGAALDCTVVPVQAPSAEASLPAPE